MEEHEPSILTREHVAALAAACRPPYDLLVEVLAYFGLRIGEALALRWESVDLSAGLTLSMTTPATTLRSPSKSTSELASPRLSQPRYALGPLGHSSSISRPSGSARSRVVATFVRPCRYRRVFPAQYDVAKG